MDSSLFTAAAGFIWFFAIVLGIMLFIAPLMIWHHAKRAADSLQTIREQMAALLKYLPSNEESLTLEIREVAKVLKSATE